MNNDRLITPLGVIRNSKPCKLKPAFANYYGLNLDRDYESHVIILRDLSLTKCLFGLTCSNRRSYEEILLFQKNEKAAFINYSNLPARIMESNEIDVLMFEGKEMTDEQFINSIMEWIGREL